LIRSAPEIFIGVELRPTKISERLSKSLISALGNLSPGIVVTRHPLGPTFSPTDLANIRANHEQLGDQILGK
jgi:hypothetical protein